MDLPDIKLVIQWKATCDFCTLWQCFGRAGRGRDQEASALLLVEKKDTDEARNKKVERAEKMRLKKREGIQVGAKRKEPTDGRHDAQSSKRPALLDRGQNSRTSDDAINPASDEDESDTGDGEMGMAIPEIHPTDPSRAPMADNDEVRRLRYSAIA
jgi:superfamily II DNA helicase RecQ